MFNNEYGNEILKGAARGLGALAVTATVGFLHKTNMARSLFFGIFCCDYCKKTPEALAEELKEKKHNEQKLIAAENKQHSFFSTYPLGIPPAIKQRRFKAKEEINQAQKELEKYKIEDYPRIEERTKIKWL